jgi:YVTN family beta-propeller protein
MTIDENKMDTISSPSAIYVGMLNCNTISRINPYYDGGLSLNLMMNQIPVKHTDLRSMLVTHYGNGSRIYVATGPYWGERENGTVSVINPITNKTEQNITVGPGPNEMVDSLLSKIYVSNRGYPGYHGSNNQTISVIDVSGHYGIPDKKEKHEIIVGQNPGPMAFNSKTHMIYVGNTGSGTVSVINGFTSKVAAGVRFKVNPANSGTIMCNNQSGTNQVEYPTNIYIYVDVDKG